MYELPFDMKARDRAMQMIHRKVYLDIVAHFSKMMILGVRPEWPLVKAQAFLA
jgi:hypothetical protein